MTPTVLLTGASGFVGRQVLRALAGQRVRLRIVVRTGKEHEVTGSTNLESIVTTPDLFSESVPWWDATCAGVDIAVHVAWYAEPGRYLQSPKNVDCLTGTLLFAKACVTRGVKRFVGVGTCFEYDVSQGYLSIETPLKPTTPYAAAKAAAFLALSQYFAAAGVQFAWCRLFYLYGAGEDSRRLVPYVRARLSSGEPAELTSGNQIRDFMNVEEAGGTIARVALSETEGAINVCSGIGITVRRLAEGIADEYGRRELLRFGARPDNLVDPPCVVGVRSNFKG